MVTESRGPAALDAVDQRLVAELMADGRLGTTVLAARLGVTPKTVLGRLRRLEEAGTLHIQAVTDMAACGYPLLVIATIQVSAVPVRSVAEAIAEIPEAMFVNVMLGDYDLAVWLLGSDLEHVRSLLEDRLVKIPGAAVVETMLCLDIRQWTRSHALLR